MASLDLLYFTLSLNFWQKFLFLSWYGPCAYLNLFYKLKSANVPLPP